MMIRMLINVTNEYINFGSRFDAALVAQLSVKWLVEAINRQWFASKWEPLNPKYLAWKARNNLDLRLWIATGWLRDNITAYWSGSAKSFVVGFKPYQRLDNGFPLLSLARVLEFGTQDGAIPPRPLFRPVLSAIENAVKGAM